MNIVKKPIKVLHILSTFQIGGTEKFLLDLLTDLKNQSNIESSVIVMNDDIHKEMSQRLLQTDYPVFFLKRNRAHFLPLKFIFDTLMLIQKNNIDIIHTHYPKPKKLSIFLKILFPKLKLVNTVHDTRIMSCLSPIDKFMHIKMVDQTVAISKAVYAECEASGIQNVALISNGIDVKHFSRGDKPENKRVKPLQILNIARFQHEKKGQHLLLKALQLCKEAGLKFHCKFVGSYNQETRGSYDFLLNLTQALGLQNDVEYVHGKTDVTEFLHASDLFVLPSLYEGFGLVVLEAMAAKVPVIVSNIDGPKDLVTDGVNGFLCKADDFLDLHHKIMAFATLGENDINQLIDAAYKFSELFDKSNMALSYADLYRKLATGPVTL